tara:strand:- start:292 stop:1422 length:1131 start_codon:yes stop_codon:yes gene_type:complete
MSVRSSSAKKRADAKLRKNRGMAGVNWCQYKLESIGIDTDYIDRTHDVWLWEREHKVEVKTTTIRKRKKGTSAEDRFHFAFDYLQIQKKAFDYAFCIGLNDDMSVNVFYVIPQPFIAYKAQKIAEAKGKEVENVAFSIAVKPVDDHTYHSICNSYDKFSLCRNNIDVFLIDNKSYFTRVKNKMAKYLIDYEQKCQDAFDKKVLELWNKGYDTKEIIKEVNGSNSWVRNSKVRLGLPAMNPKNNPPYICKKCNKSFNNISGYNTHINRQTPCKPNEKNAEWSIGREPWNKGLKGYKVKNKKYTPTIYKCDKCDFSTPWKSKYERHINKKRPCDAVYLYTCKTCGYTGNKNKYNRHMNRKTPCSPNDSYGANYLKVIQ